MKPSFNFVNLKHPDDLKDGETQLRIRRLAMTEVGKARRKPRTKRGRTEFVLQLRNTTTEPLLINRFGGGPIDSFGRYPIELDSEDRALLANSKRLGVLKDPLLMSMSLQSWQQPSQPAERILDNAQALAHHQKALRLARKMFNDPANQTSDEAIGTIVSFTCHHALLGGFASGEYMQHQKALLKIIDLRGGFDTIDKEYLRITISWSDLMGSFAQDMPPAVPLPLKWEIDSSLPPGIPRLRKPISLSWKQQLPMQLDWVFIFDDIVQLVSLDFAFNEHQFELALTSGSWIEPTVHRLLSIRPLQLGTDRGYVMEEVCRLGTLLFLAPLWRHLGHYHLQTKAISRNLQLVLLQYKAEWNELKPLLVWALYFAALETSDSAERSHFALMLSMIMTSSHLQDWSELVDIVRGVLWVDRVSAGNDESIRNEVMQIMSGNFAVPDPEKRIPMSGDDFSSLGDG
ncbi:hypothetical protein OPT61_g4146 [Boeremia exigua]|uniref:Uncharacterized protein n=1 Tax=Boeremia exigua TaxID=749465 RepID=A0ACC2IF97_9PLEO|nr:hypothetical protein OPT61_g4146 [Boeremia exigua]